MVPTAKLRATQNQGEATASAELDRQITASNALRFVCHKVFKI